jgi:hypothetical protein
MTRRTLVGRILLTQRSRVDVTLDAKPYLRVQRWHFLHVKPGATVLRLKLRHALRTGTYRLYWKATTDPSREVQRRITPLAVIAPFARAHAASPAQVVVVSDASRSTQAVPSTPNGTVRKLSSEETYLFATYHDVSVIVLDMDAHALPFLESLRTVFPTTTVIAISTRSAVRAAAARDGAVAVPPSPPSKLASLVALLLRKR